MFERNHPLLCCLRLLGLLALFLHRLRVRLLSLTLACCSLLPSPPSPLAFSFRSAIRRGATWPCQPHDAYALLERWRSRRRLRRLPPPLPPLHPRAPPIPRQLPRRNPSKRRGVAGRRGRLNRLCMTLRRRPFLLPPPRGMLVLADRDQTGRVGTDGSDPRGDRGASESGRSESVSQSVRSGLTQ